MCFQRSISYVLHPQPHITEEVAMARGVVRFLALWCSVMTLLLLWHGSSRAIDITGVQPAALDQPRINALLRLTAGGPPLTGEDIFGDVVFNIEAFYDTGSSGVILGEETAQLLNVPLAHFPEPAGPLIVFEDVGVGGSDFFNVSTPLFVGLAPFHPDTDTTTASAYQQQFGPLRLQIGPLASDSLLGDVNVFGTPVMAGKVVVIDPKPLDTFLDTLRTYVYTPGTPFNPAAEPACAAELCLL
jgi:hypothetical protein